MSPPKQGDFAYRAIVANGIYGRASFDPISGTCDLTVFHLDQATGGDYSCSSSDVLVSANQPPFKLYKGLGHIPGLGRSALDPNARDMIIKFPMQPIFRLPDVTFVFWTPSITIKNELSKPKPLDPAVAFKISHCSIIRSDSDDLTFTDCLRIAEAIRTNAVPVSPNGF